MKLKVEEIARVCHEANRAYSIAIADYSHKSWDDSDPWVRDSAALGVEFYQKNPKAGPESMHLAWMDAKKRDGWKWGPRKDPVKKEHPCMLDYDELPEEQKIKDLLFMAVVGALT